MNDAITMTTLAQLVAMGIGLATLWWRVESLIGKVRDDLAEFKVKVAQEYARNGYIKDVEMRVINQIENVAKEIHGLRVSMEKMMTFIVDQSQKTKS